VFHGGRGVRVGLSRSAPFRRELLIRWWPRFILVGVALVVIGLTMLSGAAQFVVICLGVPVAAFAVIRPLSSDDDYRREPPLGTTTTRAARLSLPVGMLGRNGCTQTDARRVGPSA
jgi:predicted anti-sigma-YlaC factor YlaD